MSCTGSLFGPIGFCPGLTADDSRAQVGASDEPAGRAKRRRSVRNREAPDDLPHLAWGT